MCFIKTPNNYVLTFLSQSLWFFHQKHYKLTPCLRDKLNLLQIWLCGFAGQEPILLPLAPLKQFSNRQLVEKCAKIMLITTLMKTSFLTDDCVSNHKNEWHQVPRRKKFCFYFHLFRRWRVSILLWWLASSHLPWRKKWDEFWLSSTGSFQRLCNMNDFAAIFFRRYYILTVYKLVTVRGRLYPEIDLSL